MPIDSHQLVRSVIDEELAAIATEKGARRFDIGRFADARKVFEHVALADDFADFLTLPAYDLLVVPLARTDASPPVSHHPQERAFR